MLSSEDVTMIVNSVDLAEIAGRFTVLNKSLQGRCPICKDGDDRFYIHKKGFWACRKCHEQPGDVIKLIQLVLGYSFADALAYLGHKPMSLPSAKRPVELGAWTDDMWQVKMREYTRACCARYQGSDGAAYLGNRCISDDVATAWGLGWDANRYGVVLPWSGKSRITGVKIRNVAPGCQPSRRYIYVKGSQVFAFGANMAEGKERAVICEGELNALSLWQVVGDEFDVFSAGGESCMAQMAAIAEHYQSCLFWMDDVSKLRKLADMVGPRGNDVYLSSPDGDDANDILQLDGGSVLGKMVMEAMR